MFDEQPDGDPHGECAAEIHNLRHLLGQCYAKLMKFGVENSDPFLMDELKLTLMQCYDEPAVSPAPTFADGMMAEDDSRFMELTNDLTHNARHKPRGEAMSAWWSCYAAPRESNMNEEIYDPDCGACERAQQDYAELERVTDDLAALVRQLVRSLRKTAPDNELADKALDYLKRKGLQGSPLRHNSVLSGKNA